MLHRAPSPSFRQKLPAFTVAEVVLSAFMLTTGLVAVMALFSASHRSAFDTQQVIVASELAQEGVEIARNIRDNAIAEKVRSGNVAYDVFNDFPNGNSRRCTISYNDTTFDCSNPDPALGINSSGMYEHGTGTGRFYRLLKIDHTGASTTARVQSFALWQNPGNNLNGNTATSWCTPYNKCVFTELLLTAWK